MSFWRTLGKSHGTDQKVEAPRDLGFGPEAPLMTQSETRLFFFPFGIHLILMPPMPLTWHWMEYVTWKYLKSSPPKSSCCCSDRSLFPPGTAPPWVERAGSVAVSDRTGQRFLRVKICGDGFVRIYTICFATGWFSDVFGPTFWWYSHAQASEIRRVLARTLEIFDCLRKKVLQLRGKPWPGEKWRRNSNWGWLFFPDVKLHVKLVLFHVLNEFWSLSISKVKPTISSNASCFYDVTVSWYIRTKEIQTRGTGSI